jgi:hypothetical protein
MPQKLIELGHSRPRNHIGAEKPFKRFLVDADRFSLAD